MIYKFNKTLILLLICSVGFYSCGAEKKEAPSKDHFKLLTLSLNQIQTAVINKNRVELDSLLVPDLRDEPEGVDSLIHFIYGFDPDFQLESFADYLIFHTYDVARIDFKITGTDTLAARQNATFTFELIDSLWYLKRWEKDQEPIGSE